MSNNHVDKEGFFLIVLFKKIDYRFLIILFIGIFLRIYSLISLPSAPDGLQYSRALQDLINVGYNTWRPPSFIFFALPFFLIVGDSILAIKLASFISGVLLIIFSFVVFSKSSLKIFKGNENAYKKSKYIGLLVSLYISIHMTLIFNNGGGIREEFLMLLFVLIYYFTFIVDNKDKFKIYTVDMILISILSLAHITAGIFIFITFISLYLISKVRNLKTSMISNVQMILLSISFLGSSLAWLVYCHFKFGNAFKTFAMQRFWWGITVDLNLYTFEGFINAVFNGLINGIILEFQILFNLIGTIFVLISIIIFIEYHQNKNILFISFFLGLNLLCLSVFIAPFGEARLLYYLFPFIFFLGFLIIVDIWYENKEMELFSFNFLRKKIKLNFNMIFVLYLAMFILKQVLFFGYYFLGKVPPTYSDLQDYLYHNPELFYTFNSPFISIVSIFENILLITLISLPFFNGRKKS